MSSVEQLKTLAEKRRKVLLDARVTECAIFALIVGFFCGSSAFGFGLLCTVFVKALGIAILASIAGCLGGFVVWSYRVYSQVTEQVNAEFAKPIAEAEAKPASS